MDKDNEVPFWKVLPALPSKGAKSLLINDHDN